MVLGLRHAGWQSLNDGVFILKGALARLKAVVFRQAPFENSQRYWLDRYRAGGNSGAGSYDHLALFKAGVINNFVAEKRIASVLEFGCGDGNQLRYANYPSYIGLDISPKAIAICKSLFGSDNTKTFDLTVNAKERRAELVLSLDVIFHLIEDDVFDAYMRDIFKSSTQYVIIYSSNTEVNEGNQPPHVRHRMFSCWIDNNAPQWKLIRTVQNAYPYNGNHLTTSFSDFYMYELSSI